MNRKISLILPLLVFVLMFASTVTATTSLTYVYDANGNLISEDGKYYEYNDTNQLVKVRHGDQNGPVVAEYVYDYTGQRIKKVDNGATTYYIGKHYETQTDGSNTQNTSYYFANGERVAKKDALGDISYYHSDHLGGTNIVTDSSGNLIERIKYYPFGEIREGGNEKYLYTGKEKDKLSDFYYYEARYYNPEIKHFTQADVIAIKAYDPQTLNRYSYVSNNPIRYRDIDGHDIYYGDGKKWNKEPTAQIKKYLDSLAKSKHGNILWKSLLSLSENKDIYIGFGQLDRNTLGLSYKYGENGFAISLNQDIYLNNRTDNRQLIRGAETLAHEMQHVIDYATGNIPANLPTRQEGGSFGDAVKRMEAEMFARNSEAEVAYELGDPWPAIFYPGYIGLGAAQGLQNFTCGGSCGK